MPIYDSSAVYIQSAKDIKDKVKRIKAIITALLVAAESSAGNSDLTQYTLDDGQTKISCMYRSVTEILNAVKGWEALLVRYENDINGHVSRLMDEKNFIRNRRNGF